MRTWWVFCQPFYSFFLASNQCVPIIIEKRWSWCGWTIENFQHCKKYSMSLWSANSWLISLLTLSCVLHLRKCPLYHSPDVAVCSISGGWCRVNQKGSLKMVILFQQCLNVNTIIIKPILMLTRDSTWHFWDSSILSLKLAQSASASFELRPIDSNLPSISPVSDYLTVLLFNLETFSHFGAFVPCGCHGGWFWCLSSLETVRLWSILQSAAHKAFLTDIMPITFASHWNSLVSVNVLHKDASMMSCCDGVDERDGVSDEEPMCSTDFKQYKAIAVAAALHLLSSILLPMMQYLWQPLHWSHWEWWVYQCWALQQSLTWGLVKPFPCHHQSLSWLGHMHWQVWLVVSLNMTVKL